MNSWGGKGHLLEGGKKCAQKQRLVPRKELRRSFHRPFQGGLPVQGTVMFENSLGQELDHVAEGKIAGRKLKRRAAVSVLGNPEGEGRASLHHPF